MREWLTCSQLAVLRGTKANTERKRISRGIYTLIKPDETTKRKGPNGGHAWVININDPAIPDDLRALWKENRERSLGMAPHQDIETLKGVMGELMEPITRSLANILQEIQGNRMHHGRLPKG